MNVAQPAILLDAVHVTISARPDSTWIEKSSGTAALPDWAQTDDAAASSVKPLSTATAVPNLDAILCRKHRTGLIIVPPSHADTGLCSTAHAVIGTAVQITRDSRSDKHSDYTLCAAPKSTLELRRRRKLTSVSLERPRPCGEPEKHSKARSDAPSGPRSFPSDHCVYRRPTAISDFAV
jgi:hypothetical protein